MTRKFEVFPIRSNGKAFVRCELRRATSFAVFCRGRLVSRHPRQSEAQLACDSHNAGEQSNGHGYRLGARMPARSTAQ